MVIYEVYDTFENILNNFGNFGKFGFFLKKKDNTVFLTQKNAEILDRPFTTSDN